MSELKPQTWVEIDLEAIRRNFARFAEKLPPTVKIIPAVKKEAYGHGLIEVARMLADEPRHEAFCVATIDEALRLRRAGIQSSIFCMSVLRDEALRVALAEGIILTVTDLSDAREISESAKAIGKTAETHLKIDTGLGRLGRLPHEIIGLLPEIVRLTHLRLDAVWTHLADGGNDRAGAKAQAERLANFLKEAQQTGFKDLRCHLGGSDAFVLCDEFQFDAIRSGIALYGYHPGIEGLEPAMTFKSRVIYRRRAPAGTKISYGGTHTLRRDSELALVGAGYGNGYPRSLSNRGQVLIRGRRLPILGRVCMDQIVVDVTDFPSVELGDEAVLFGRQGSEILSADEVANWAETISYELLCSAGQINPRKYI